MKTRSRRGRLSVRKTRSRSQRERKSQHQRERKSQHQRKRKSQRGGNFIQDTLGVPKGAYVTIDLDPEDGSAPVLIQKEQGMPTEEEEGADQ